MTSTQLTLSLSLSDEATFANFFVGKNATLLNALQALLHGEIPERVIYLWGEQGVGRSHLLQACCHSAHEQGMTVAYIPLRDHLLLSPEVFDNLEQMDWVVLDNVDAVLNHRGWEEALFHLYNRMRDAGKNMLVSGGVAPAGLACLLPDLRTRLAWGLVFQVIGLSDEEKMQALQMRAHQRGLELSDEVAQFILRHHSRCTADLFAALTQLDQASMVAKRRLTIPFVKETLAL